MVRQPKPGDSLPFHSPWIFEEEQRAGRAVQDDGLATRIRAALDPITDEWQVFERAYSRPPTVADMVERFAQHRRVPQRWNGERWTGGYDCAGNPCRCGRDLLIEALGAAPPLHDPTGDES